MPMGFKRNSISSPAAEASLPRSFPLQVRGFQSSKPLESGRNLGHLSTPKFFFSKLHRLHHLQGCKPTWYLQVDHTTLSQLFFGGAAVTFAMR